MRTNSIRRAFDDSNTSYSPCKRFIYYLHTTWWYLHPPEALLIPTLSYHNAKQFCSNMTLCICLLFGSVAIEEHNKFCAYLRDRREYTLTFYQCFSVLLLFSLPVCPSNQLIKTTTTTVAVIPCSVWRWNWWNSVQ